MNDRKPCLDYDIMRKDAWGNMSHIFYMLIPRVFARGCLCMLLQVHRLPALVSAWFVVKTNADQPYAHNRAHPPILTPIA